jgi:hypothetical protein
MSSPSASTPDTPRVLIYSERNVIARKWHALQYEFEDVAQEVGLADVVAPGLRAPGPLGKAAYRIQRGVGRRGMREVHLAETTITREYDLFFAFFAFPSDIPHIQRLKGWRDRCAKAVCYIGEHYTHEVAQNRAYLELLRELGFDRVYLFNMASAASVEEVVGCPVEFMGHGVDSARWSPYPLVPPRTVDLYQYGRRSDVTHAAALDMVRKDGTFYIYDTVFNVPLEDYRAHRTMVAETMKRARYFFAYRPGENLGRALKDDPISSRFFEAIGGGAVLLGSRPHIPQYDEVFPWADATIEIPFEAPDLREIIAALDAQPERIHTARMHNIVNTLRSLDWVYNWARIAEQAGLPQTPGMQQRMAWLAELADIAEQRETAALAALD